MCPKAIFGFVGNILMEIKTMGSDWNLILTLSLRRKTTMEINNLLNKRKLKTSSWLWDSKYFQKHFLSFWVAFILVIQKMGNLPNLNRTKNHYPLFTVFGFAHFGAQWFGCGSTYLWLIWDELFRRRTTCHILKQLLRLGNPSWKPRN
jgi:hypothetical protein